MLYVGDIVPKRWWQGRVRVLWIDVDAGDYHLLEGAIHIARAASLTRFSIKIVERDEVLP